MDHCVLCLATLAKMPQEAPVNGAPVCPTCQAKLDKSPQRAAISLKISDLIIREKMRRDIAYLIQMLEAGAKHQGFRDFGPN